MRIVPSENYRPTVVIGEYMHNYGYELKHFTTWLLGRDQAQQVAHWQDKYGKCWGIVYITRDSDEEVGSQDDGCGTPVPDVTHINPVILAPSGTLVTCREQDVNGECTKPNCSCSTIATVSTENGPQNDAHIGPIMPTPTKGLV